MVQPRSRPSPVATAADTEVLVRLMAARTIIDAILSGRLWPDPDLLDALADLVDSAGVWSKRAAA